MKAVDYQGLRIVVRQRIRFLDSAGPVVQSTEWYLLKYLHRIARNTEQPVSDHAVENSMRALLRFYVDAIDPVSELGQLCREIFEAHRHTLRNGRQS